MDANQKPRQWRAFLYALAIGAMVFLPFVIYDGGYFIYYGDFNVQQIPFYQLAHEAVRSGDLFWSWYTDLGANFIGSYSFYLLFSPFFWLTLLFPTAWVPYLMAPLLVLKTACASMTAYLYLSRFVKDTNYAVIGALLYAFSGWMDYNIFFNHFHEAAIFFPLLLLGVEKLVTENRKGLFALAVAANFMVNYWFFVGEAVFVVLYVFVRMTDKTWRMSFAKFCRIAVEAVLGAGLAAAVVLPSVMALMGNPRTGPEELLTGWNIWVYWHEQRQPAILQSLFFPPELPSRPNFLPDHGAKWASLSGWLPLFAMTGVLAYFFQNKNNWLKKILALCLVFAMVPILNSMFILFNDSYYARWFYMPVLLMAMATIRALEDSAGDTAPFARAIKWSAVVILVYTVMSGLTPNYVDDALTFGLADNPLVMWVFSAIAAVCLLIVAVLLLRMRESARFRQYTLVGIMVIALGFNIFYLANGKNSRDRSQWVIDHAIHGRENIDLPGLPFGRTDVYDSTDNIAMYWHRPNIQAFHSIVPPSIMEFYPAVGVTRDVGSRPEPEFFALRPLLSVRWLFIEESKENQTPMEGYTLYGTQNGFNVYENDNFLPMGFAYDTFATRSQMEDVATNSRSNLMLRAVVMENDAINRNLDILRQLGEDDYGGFNTEAMANDVLARREFTADTFAFDTRGFTATTSFERDQLLFFSVPWEEGWSATLASGDRVEPLRIERANIGFMAVRVPAGECTIRFSYMTPGLLLGIVISGGFLLIFLGYMLLFRAGRRVPEEDLDLHRSLLSGETINLSWEEYLAIYSDKEARAANLQKVLNEAAARHVAERLEQSEQTLHFSPGDAHIPENTGEANGEDSQIPSAEGAVDTALTAPDAAEGGPGQTEPPQA